MKLALALLLLPGIAVAQWRPVAVSSKTFMRDTNENFRRASVFANQKLSKFGDDTMYGALTVSSITVSGSATLNTMSAASATLPSVAITTMTASSSTVTALTVTGDATFSGATSTATFSGMVIISSYSATTNGFTYLPGGLILQWGTTADLAPNAGLTVTLPKAWPNGLLSVTATHKGSAAGTSATHTAVFAQATSGSETTQITISKGVNGGGAAGTFPVFWQAVGY